ncbi:MULTISPECIES: SMP-30/gluconolactonase/LRE family protein [unclassified Pseudomonas]|uniref:SMP-30/gluconolactonase/LRE family protein n=1 Tax=unclassified Pseudomonas TaxID=196821 RepID=UPI000D367FF9|nr:MULTISPECIES: SMP-30/gluconolactonase/LRE family protein [unclassified Pseudomonas]RAU44305.1 SMP-30/gluconolactonase/LRE family protein [Pseudomonas sp. RIT 409]RAU51048.1 SMP-30/gluconolactonase/LRE family protein [Pseudomonas sp. RIT 412]
MKWQAVSDQRFKLAEGPFWDDQQQALYWVDIAGFRALRLYQGQVRHWQFNEPVSAFIPTSKGDALVTLASGVYRLNLDSPAERPALTVLCVADPVGGNRANEARCDSQGRLWLGSMQNNLDAEGGDVPLERRSGGLFRVEAGGRVTALLAGQGIVNTLLWADDDRTLLTADSLDGVIYRYPIQADGALGERDVWASEHPRGVPDGSAMDAQGYVWNARWGGHCLIRFAPDGRVDQLVELPLSHPTSCVFGGPDMTTLFVTSARPASEALPLDGAVLQVETGIRGLASHRFAG